MRASGARDESPVRLMAGDVRGAVYVEFVIAFIPMFLLFLGTVQLGLLGVAHIVVQHAATRGVRSAVVVLEDDPQYYGGAPRGDTELGSMPPLTSGDVLRRFGASAGTVTAGKTLEEGQNGARMAVIRYAARTPLAVLAPSFGGRTEDLRGALGIGVHGAPTYNQAATTITLQAAPNSNLLATSPVPSEHGATVTVRVSYLYTCSVPLMRRLLCEAPRMLEVARQWSRAQLPVSARLQRITAEATLPNQGARYE